MTNLGALFVRLGLDARDFTKGMSKSKDEIKGIQKHTKNLGDGIQTLRRIAIAGFAGWGLKRIAGEFLEASKAAEGFKVRLNALLGSTAEGGRLFKEMSDYAARVPYEFREIMEAATSLSGVMRGGVDEIKKWMPMIGDLAAATGLNLRETTGQVIRMYSAGAASADMFRERGVLAMMGFQAGVKYTAEETQKMMFDSWNKTGSQFKDVTKELAKTWSGTMSMFSDQWFQFRNMVMDSGPFLAMKEQAQDLLAEINRLKDEGQLEIWAKNTAKVIIDAFEIASYGPELFLNWIKAVQLQFSSVMAAASWVGKQMYDAILLPLKGWKWLTETLGLSAELIDRLIAPIQNWRSEMEHMQNAGVEMSIDLVNGIMDTHEAFDKLRQKLEAVKTASDTAKTETVKNARAMADAVIATEEQIADETIKAIDDVVKADYDAAQERIDIARDFADERINIEMDTSSRIGQQLGQYTGLPVGSGSGGTIASYYRMADWGWKQPITREEWEKDQLKEIADNTKDLVRWSSGQEQRDIERAQREQQQITQAFWRNQEQLWTSLFQAGQSINTFIGNMGVGGLAPVTGVGAYGKQYASLFESAFGDPEALQSLMSFIPDFLANAQLYGTNYTDIFQSVIDGLGALQEQYETMGWLAQLGIGDTASDLDALISAFNDLGISTIALKDAAMEAAGMQGVYGLGQGLTDTQAPFQNVIDALGTMSGDTKDKLIAIGDMWKTLVTGIGGSMTSITSAIQGAYNTAQTNPSITYEPVTVYGTWRWEPGITGRGWIADYPGQQTLLGGKGYEPIKAPEWVLWGPPAQEGGLWEGNKGGEWFVPTYEPERSRFLDDVGIEEALEVVLQKYDGGNKTIIVPVSVDGREIAKVTAKYGPQDGEFVTAMRGLQ